MNNIGNYVVGNWIVKSICRLCGYQKTVYLLGKFYIFTIVIFKLYQILFEYLQYYQNSFKSLWLIINR